MTSRTILSSSDAQVGKPASYLPLIGADSHVSASAEPREEILRIALTLDRAGFMPSKSGNISCRLGRGLLITPAGLPYAETARRIWSRSIWEGRCV
jgi:hypothetical protein